MKKSIPKSDETKNKTGLRKLFKDELHDILSCEKQIIKSLPALVKAAESPELKKAFSDHLKETKTQVQRILKIFRIVDIDKNEKFCKAAEGLIHECKESLKSFKKSPVLDAALISKAQRIEHYEISAYGTLRTIAKELDLDTVADLLQESLDEEANADKKLTKIAEGGFIYSGINHKAHLWIEKKKAALHKNTSPKQKHVSVNHKKVKRQTPIRAR